MSLIWHLQKDALFETDINRCNNLIMIICPLLGSLLVFASSAKAETLFKNPYFMGQWTLSEDQIDFVNSDPFKKGSTRQIIEFKDKNGVPIKPVSSSGLPLKDLDLIHSQLDREEIRRKAYIKEQNKNKSQKPFEPAETLPPIFGSSARETSVLQSDIDTFLYLSNNIVGLSTKEYDAIKKKFQDQYFTPSQYAEDWWGFCHQTALSSMDENLVALDQQMGAIICQGTPLKRSSIRELAAFLTENDPAIVDKKQTLGTRTLGNATSTRMIRSLLGISDLEPREIENQLKELMSKGNIFVFERDPTGPVWNNPVYKATFDKKTLDPNQALLFYDKLPLEYIQVTSKEAQQLLKDLELNQTQLIQASKKWDDANEVYLDIGKNLPQAFSYQENMFIILKRLISNIVPSIIADDSLNLALRERRQLLIKLKKLFDDHSAGLKPGVHLELTHANIDMADFTDFYGQSGSKTLTDTLLYGTLLDDQGIPLKSFWISPEIMSKSQMGGRPDVVWWDRPPSVTSENSEEDYNFKLKVLIKLLTNPKCHSLSKAIDLYGLINSFKGKPLNEAQKVQIKNWTAELLKQPDVDHTDVRSMIKELGYSSFVEPGTLN